MIRYYIINIKKTFYYIPRCWYPIYVYIHIYLLCFSCKFLEPCMGWWRLAGVKYRREFDTCCRGELGLTASSSKINKFKHKQHIYIQCIYTYINLYWYFLYYLICIYIIWINIYILLYPILLITSFFGKLTLVPVFFGTKLVAVNPNPCLGISIFLFPYFFIPEGSKRCYILLNAINVALENTLLRSF